MRDFRTVPAARADSNASRISNTDGTEMGNVLLTPHVSTRKNPAGVGYVAMATAATVFADTLGLRSKVG